MSEREQDKKQQYRRVRSDFDELETDDKVVFLFEAAVSTLAHGIDAFGRVVSEEISQAFGKRAEKKANGHKTGASDDTSSAHDADGPHDAESPHDAGSRHDDGAHQGDSEHGGPADGPHDEHKDDTP